MNMLNILYVLIFQYLLPGRIGVDICVQGLGGDNMTCIIVGLGEAWKRPRM